jgi:hypothetical protein
MFVPLAPTLEALEDGTTVIGAKTPPSSKSLPALSSFSLHHHFQIIFTIILHNCHALWLPESYN